MVDNHVSFEILSAVAATIAHVHRWSIAFDDDVMARLNASAVHDVENDNDHRKTAKNEMRNWK